MRYAGKTLVAIAALLTTARLSSAQTADTLGIAGGAVAQTEEKRQESNEISEPQRDTLPPFDEKAPMLRSDAAAKLYRIRKINVRGIEYLDPVLVSSSAGLEAGDSIYLPGLPLGDRSVCCITGGAE